MADTGNSVRTLMASILLVCLFSCATTGMPGFQAGEPKNSLPFVEKERIARTHSIVILPFYRDSAGWQKTSFDILSSSSQISLIQPQQYEMFIKGPKKNLSLLVPEERPPAVSAVGRALDADAVLNGVILPRGDRQEVVLQLISSEDSRVIWWQAVEIRGEKSSSDERRQVISKMLEPLMDHLALKERPRQRPEAARTEPAAGPDSPARTDSQQGNVPKQRPDRKMDKKPRVPAPDDVSPM